MIIVLTITGLLCEYKGVKENTAQYGQRMNEMIYTSAYHEAFCKLSNLDVKELPPIVRTKAASPFLPDAAIYEGTGITPDQVQRESAKYSEKYYAKVDKNARAYDADKYDNDFGYLG